MTRTYSGAELHPHYAGPARQLLFIGDAGSHESAGWPNYPSRYGLGSSDVAALVRMACDPALHDSDGDNSAVWAPVHAWRALGQLRATEAAMPLLDYLKMGWDDDTTAIELPVVFGMIGPAAIPAIAMFLAEPNAASYAAATAMAGLREIVDRHPTCRGACIEVLLKVLQPRVDADPTVNGFAIATLLDLEAAEAIEVMREAFRRKAVDITIAGDEEEVEIALGLRECRSILTPRYALSPWDWPARGQAGSQSQRPSPTPSPVSKVGRNDPCPCGSGKKFKKCCMT